MSHIPASATASRSWRAFELWGGNIRRTRGDGELESASLCVKTKEMSFHATTLVLAWNWDGNFWKIAVLGVFDLDAWYAWHSVTVIQNFFKTLLMDGISIREKRGEVTVVSRLFRLNKPQWRHENAKMAELTFWNESDKNEDDKISVGREWRGWEGDSCT